MSESQTLNQTQAPTSPIRKIASEIALKSHEDDVFMIDGGGTVKLEKGRYGGWLLRGAGPESGRGVWCYTESEQEASADVLEKLAGIRERIVKVARSLGIEDEPKAFTRTLKFRVVDVSQKKATERYTVYDVMPTGEEAEAVLVAIKFEVRMSRRGKCYNDVCRVRDRLEMLLKAEFKGEEAEADGVTVIVPYDVSKLERAVAKLMEERDEEGGDEGGGDEEAVEEGGGGAGDGEGMGRAKDFIGYLILVKFPRNVDGDAVMAKLEEAIKQKLKELNVTALVKIAKADL